MLSWRIFPRLLDDAPCRCLTFRREAEGPYDILVITEKNGLELIVTANDEGLRTLERAIGEILSANQSDGAPVVVWKSTNRENAPAFPISLAISI